MKELGFIAASLGGYFLGRVSSIMSIPWQIRVFCLGLIFLISFSVYVAADQLEKMVPRSR